MFELLEGGDLLHYLCRQPAMCLPESDARLLFRQVGRNLVSLVEGAIFTTRSWLNLPTHPPTHLPLRQILSGVAHAHNQHICHHDLKVPIQLLPEFYC